MLRQKGAPFPSTSNTKRMIKLQPLFQGGTPAPASSTKKSANQTRHKSTGFTRKLPVDTKKTNSSVSKVATNASMASTPSKKVIMNQSSPPSIPATTVAAIATPTASSVIAAQQISADTQTIQKLSEMKSASLDVKNHVGSPSVNTITLLLTPVSDSKNEKTVEEKTDLLKETIERIVNAYDFNHRINVPMFTNPKTQYEALKHLGHEILTTLIEDYSTDLNPYIVDLVAYGADITLTEQKDDPEYPHSALPIDSLHLALIKNLPTELIHLLLSKYKCTHEEITMFNYHEVSWSPIVVAALFARNETLELLIEKLGVHDAEIARREINLLWKRVTEGGPLTIYLGWDKVIITQETIARASMRLLKHDLRFKSDLYHDAQNKKNKHRRVKSIYLDVDVYADEYKLIPEQAAVYAKEQINMLLLDDESELTETEENKKKLIQYNDLYETMMRNVLYNDNHLYTQGIIDNNMPACLAGLFGHDIPKIYSDVKIGIISLIQENMMFLLSTLKNEKEYPQICRDVLKSGVFSPEHNTHGVTSKWRNILEKEVAAHPIPKVFSSHN